MSAGTPDRHRTYDNIRTYNISIMAAIVKTDFNFPGQVGKYVGKVRDVYNIKDE